MTDTEQASSSADAAADKYDGPLLELDKVSQAFPDESGGSTQVLESISFSAESRETIAILGPSGCGKSTILRVVSGMYDRYTPMPTSGEVRIKGKKVGGAHDDVLTVFQKPVLNQWLNVKKNVMLPFSAGLWGKGVSAADRNKRVEEVIEAVGLSDSMKLQPRQLSGGMQQRVSLAARLVLRPSILCLDEPFSALDPQTRREMQELVLTLWDRYPCLALFVTHDVSEALRIADRIVVLSTRPARVVVDMTIAEPKPRSDAWLGSAEAQGIESQIISRIREATSAASRGTLAVDV
jgi:NitT/TauT family transport system ATP-binding protein